MSKNAEGWIRHNSKQQPVDDHVEVEIRTRGGDYEICEASGFTWNATEENQIMAYRLHKPAEQAVNMEAFSECISALGDSHADVMESVLSRLDGPIQWRDRIAEIDATTQALTAERAELVQKLASDGFALIGRVVEPVEDMSDWRNWKVGDFVTIEGNSSCHKFKTGGITRIKSLSDEDGCGFSIEHIDSSDFWYVGYPDLSWHSRPSA